MADIVTEAEIHAAFEAWWTNAPPSHEQADRLGVSLEVAKSLMREGFRIGWAALAARLLDEKEGR